MQTLVYDMYQETQWWGQSVHGLLTDQDDESVCEPVGLIPVSLQQEEWPLLAISAISWQQVVYPPELVHHWRCPPVPPPPPPPPPPPVCQCSPPSILHLPCVAHKGMSPLYSPPPPFRLCIPCVTHPLSLIISGFFFMSANAANGIPQLVTETMRRKRRKQ